MNKTFLFPLFLLSILSLNSFSQNMPIGYWRSHLPYNNTVSVATDGITLYSGSSESFFTYNIANDEITTYSKAEGMADVGIAIIGYDATSDYAIITYTNGNIDLFKDETFFNIPDIKLKTISPKKINNIYTENDMAYLSASFGIVVVNLEKKEIKETYSFVDSSNAIAVNSFTAAGGFFYAVTSNGIYKANKNHANLQAFSAWQLIIPDKSFINSATANNTVYVSSTDSVFRIESDSLVFVYKSQYQINKLSENNGNILYISEYLPQAFNGRIKILDLVSGQAIDSFHVYGNPTDVVVSDDNAIWVADAYNGLGKRNASNTVDFVLPNGPASSGAFDIMPYNGDVWVAHGGYDENWTYLYNGSGLSRFKDGKWTTYNRRTSSVFNELTDFIRLAKDPVDGTVYAGSYKDGLIIIKPDGTIQHEEENSPYVETHFLDFTSYRTAGATFDLNGNLWLNNSGGVHELTVKTTDGNIYRYSGAGSRNNAASILADDNNLKWYILPTQSDGVAIYDDNHSPDNPNDDNAAKISASQYGLTFVNCIAKDKSNAIWVGTNDGIGVINCSPDQIFSGQCEIRKPIVQYDQFAGYLFQNEKVRTIAVDGANRKWIGTTNGVWLISPDGDKIIYRFTAENSPLPSNDVQKIAIDPITGDVYIGTASGLVSYRSTATDGGEANQSVTTFPNPVPSNYSGTIAIKGLVENADVRITDISGQLIYRTRALGGQAIWNGLDYTGRRPQTGVYLIFVTNKDGSQTHAGKMVFVE